MKVLQRILAAAVVLAAAIPASGGPAPRGAFEVRHLLVHGRRTDTVFYDFTGDGIPDALNVSVDHDAEPPTRWLALHVGGKDRRYGERPDQVWSVIPQACALAFGDWLPGGGVEIGLVVPDGLRVHAAVDGRMGEDPVKLLHLRTWFESPPDRTLPIWSWAQDLDGDRKDDLALPTPEGYRVYFQTAPGTFGASARIEADVAPDKRALPPRRFALDFNAGVSRGYAPGTSFFTLYDELPRIVFSDIDGDGRQDVVTIRGGSVTTFFQDRPRAFARAKSAVVPGLADPLKKDSVSLSDIQLLDVNGDAIPDLVVTKVEGDLGLLTSLKTSILPYLGTGRSNFQADATIRIDGVSLSPQFLDMDGDGKLDCLASRLRTDVLAGAFAVKVLGDITLSYEIFQHDGVKFEGPVWSRDLRVTLDDIQKRGAASRPLLHVPGDLSGDGRPDLVMFNPKTSAVEVYRGRPAWNLGSKRAVIDFEKDVALSHPVERDPKWMTFQDLDGDGRTDVLLQYASLLVLLYSRP